MERLIQSQFAATVLCWTQDSEVRRVEVVRAFAHNSPYLDITQYPHADFLFSENTRMKKTTAEHIADRLNFLMASNADLNTNQKVEDRSGVSKNTVRRLRGAEGGVDVSLAKVEMVAAAFGLTLSEFVAPAGSSNGIDADELVLIHKYRQLKHKKDKEEVLFFVSAKSSINKLLDGPND